MEKMKEAFAQSSVDTGRIPHLHKLLKQLGDVPGEASILLARHHLWQGDPLQASAILDALELLQARGIDALQLRVQVADALGDHASADEARVRLAANEDVEIADIHVMQRPALA